MGWEPGVVVMVMVMVMTMSPHGFGDGTSNVLRRRRGTFPSIDWPSLASEWW